MKKRFDICLAIETSCDDTSVSLISNDGRVLGLKSQNQDDVHSPFGGVIPELACRNHTMRLLPLLESLMAEAKVSWSDIDGIAVTSKPGLFGSLLVGVTVAKSLSLIYGLPLIGVNHIEGHLHAPFLKDDEYEPPTEFDYPFIGLCVSGGHTSLFEVKRFGSYTLLGKTVDDAAGEAFDKFGKLLGLGYPAGAKVDSLAKEGDRTRFPFPKAFMDKGNLKFSFSGLKTSGSLKIKQLGPIDDQTLKDLCASYQEAIAEVLVEKTIRALDLKKLRMAVVTGGVSCNSRVRQLAKERLSPLGYNVVIPPPRYCTDNAAMIGYVGIKKFNKGQKDSFKLSPEAYMKISEL